MPRKILFIFIICLVFTIGFTGTRTEAKVSDDSITGKLTGMDAPEYETILDWYFWMEEYNPTALMAGMHRDDRKIIETIMDVVGIEGLRQLDIQAMESAEGISIRSLMRYEGYNSDSLLSIMGNVEPAKSDLLNNFTRDNLWALMAFGNYKGYMDAIFDWLIDTDAAVEVVESINFGRDTDEEDVIKLAIYGGQVALRGIRVTLEEDFYPYLGDEKILALYENPDFLGYHVYSNPNPPPELENGFPVRFVLAIELEQPGITELILDLLDEYDDALESLAYEITYDEDAVRDFWEVKTRSMGGYDIHYFDFGFDVTEIEIGWVELEDALIIGTMGTLKNLYDYYDPSAITSGWPESYSKYLYADPDEFFEEFPFQVDGFIEEGINSLEESIAWRNENRPDSPYTQSNNKLASISIDLFGEALQAVTSPNGIGKIEFVSRTKDGGFETTLRCGKNVANILLRLIDMLEAVVEYEVLDPYSGEYSLPMEEEAG